MSKLTTHIDVKSRVAYDNDALEIAASFQIQIY